MPIRISTIFQAEPASPAVPAKPFKIRLLRRVGVRHCALMSHSLTHIRKASLTNLFILSRGQKAVCNPEICLEKMIFIGDANNFVIKITSLHFIDRTVLAISLRLVEAHT